MRSFTFILITVLAVIFATGCAYTEITSYKDPDFSGASYGNLIVVVKTDDMKQMVIGENSFEKVFQKLGVMLKKGHSIFKPTEKKTDAEKMQTFKEMNIDGVIQVTFKSKNMKTNVHASRDHLSTSTTEYLKFTVDLIDVATGKNSWTASTETQGEDLSLATMMDSLADAVFNDLKLNNLLK
ncbi:MAG: hypothetical protein K8S87_03870 [Planctomycetes bacterium]|nr:hypothetical protein [Planctomycetota bacterium]